MRDLETVEAALTVAETGHLVLVDAAHQLGRADHQPHHRHLPRAAAAAGARAALADPAGRRLAAAHPARRRPRPRARGRGDDPQPRHPQPHPRGQDPPALLAAAGRPDQVRHADDDPVARSTCTRASSSATTKRWATPPSPTSCARCSARRAAPPERREERICWRRGCRAARLASRSAHWPHRSRY